MEITLQQAARQLLEQDHITILCHRKPDGDTTGSALALYEALSGLGKKVRIRCGDPFPEQFRFLTQAYEEPGEFQEQFIVAVDVASAPLLGSLGGRIRPAEWICASTIMVPTAATPGSCCWMAARRQRRSWFIG